MARRLILHIGNYKTGTTSIQRSLLAGGKVLASQGAALFHRDPDGHERGTGNIHRWFESPSPGQFDARRGARIASPERLAAALSGIRQDTVIASSEVFSLVFDPDHVRALHDVLRKHFGTITIVCYLRRQDLQAVSHFQQASRSPRELPPRRYSRELLGPGTLALPGNQSRLHGCLNYHQRLSMWLDVFGPDHCVIRVFEKDQLAAGDAVADFVAATGLAPGLRSLRRNQSQGFARTKLGHVMDKAGVAPHLFWFLRNSVSDFGQSQPSREQALAFYEPYRASNQALAARLGRAALFCEDFSMYPDTPGDQWTEASAEPVLLDVLAAIDRAYGGLDARTLRVAAVMAFPFRPDIGRRLWTAARCIREASSVPRPPRPL